MTDPASTSQRPGAGGPPPLPSSVGATPPSRQRRSPWKWFIPSAIGLVGVGIFLTQCVFVRAEDSTRTGKSEPGVVHFNERISRAPWSIHVVKIDRSRTDLEFVSALAGGKVLGVSRISEQARAYPAELGRVIAAVNGDFYERDNRTYAGDPRGLQIVNGELVSAPSTATVWFDAQRNPHVDDIQSGFTIKWPNGGSSPFGLNQQRRPNMVVLYTSTYGESTRVSGGRDLILERDGSGPWLPLQSGRTYRAKVKEVVTAANTRLAEGVMVLSVGTAAGGKIPTAFTPGDVVEISTATTPDLKEARNAISGGPAVLVNRKPFVGQADNDSGNYSERSKYERHPRSGIGWNDTHIFLITVDGRQPGLSVGMTLNELGNYMLKLGCTDGMNFDGGASSSLWMSGQIINDPCQGERAVANSLLLVRKPEKK